MKKTLSIFGVILALTTLSFKGDHASSNLTIGTYGVCGCADAANSPSKIELTINKDNTFQYINNSDPAKKIDVKGNWTRKNNTIQLTNYNSDISIHNKWSIDEKCLKSRKGLNFTRICHLKAC